MSLKEKKELLQSELLKNRGIFRLAPCWVPRAFMVPGEDLN